MADRQVFDYCEEHGEYFQAYAGRCPKCLAKEDAAEVVDNHAEAIRAAIAPDPTTLHAIADRLREATGPDWRLFDDAWTALFGEDWAKVATTTSGDRHHRAVHFGELLRIRAWLDACAALQAEALGPEWRKRMPIPDTVRLFTPTGEFADGIREDENEPLMWLSAIVAAAIAEGESR